ncbi:hypothetical protein [Microcoleus sp. Pol12B5]|uniref:hypothetical protein n=1 Tax=Microcoleus sp. Pol12B5 TaxID=3055396 RepID=UPI002FD1D79E
MSTKGFQQVRVPTRTFEIELKHRPPDDMTGDREELVKTEQIQVPDLGNREWEKRWVLMATWNTFTEEEAKRCGINQAFIFTKGYRELVFRIEVNPFQDEEAHKLDVPAQSEYSDWLAAVRKKFKKLYAFELDDWMDG